MNTLCNIPLHFLVCNMWQLEKADAMTTAPWSLLSGIGCVNVWARLPLSELGQAAGHLSISPSANP